MNLCCFLAPTCQDLFQYAPACNPIQPISIQSNQKIDRIGKKKYFVQLQTSIGYGIRSNMGTSFSKGYQHTLVQADQDP